MGGSVIYFTDCQPQLRSGTLCPEGVGFTPLFGFMREVCEVLVGGCEVQGYGPDATGMPRSEQGQRIRAPGQSTERVP